MKRISFINYWIHWIDSDFKIQKLCLGVTRFPHPHNAKLITSNFKCKMSEYKLDSKTFVASCRLLKLEREPCLGHNFHLLVATDLIQNNAALQPVRDLIKRMKEIYKDLVFKYENLKKIYDEEYNRRLHSIISTVQNICKGS